MALNSSDKQLIDDLAIDLRARYTREISRSDAVTTEDIDGQNYNFANTSAATPVAITKGDLRDNSGRRVVRDAYMTEVAAALNQKLGVSARADLDQGVIYAHAIPDGNYEQKPMSMSKLKMQAETAREAMRRDEEDD